MGVMLGMYDLAGLLNTLMPNSSDWPSTVGARRATDSNLLELVRLVRSSTSFWTVLNMRRNLRDQILETQNRSVACYSVLCTVAGDARSWGVSRGLTMGQRNDTGPLCARNASAATWALDQRGWGFSGASTRLGTWSLHLVLRRRCTINAFLWEWSARQSDTKGKPCSISLHRVVRFCHAAIARISSMFYSVHRQNQLHFLSVWQYSIAQSDLADRDSRTQQLSGGLIAGCSPARQRIHATPTTR